MGFLAPLFLLAATAVAVPLLLHLFHRHESRRFSFPALRYLLRTEKEHARRIRLRQLILLILRVSVILLLVAAGARLFVTGSGRSHDPTAVAVLLDNSMSSGLVVGEERVLDVLKRMALETAAQATPDDRLWVIRVGEPWDAASPGGPAEAAERIRSTDVSAARGDVSQALARARELLLASGFASMEIHLLSDLQATAFAPAQDGPPAGEIPVLLYQSPSPPPGNRYLHEALVGGGLPPLAGQRSEVSVTVGASAPVDSTEVPLRLVIDERMRGASTVLPGRAVLLPVGPFPEGQVEGYVEIDPDALRDDDHRAFAFHVRPPPTVGLEGESGFFLDQVLGVLEDGGRIRRAGQAGADVVLSLGGTQAGGDTGAALVLFPPADPTLLPALNRRLVQSGIPWRVGPAAATGETPVGENRIPVELEGVRIYQHYALEPSPEPGGAGEVLVRLATGEPWIVSGQASGRAYLLVGTPLDPEASTMPVSTVMVPLLEWITARWSAPGAQARRIEAGQALSVASSATFVVTPDGARHPVDGTYELRETRQAGVYTVLAGDSVLERITVVAPLRESLLTPVDDDGLEEGIGSRVVKVQDASDWPTEVFLNRQGPELWRPLLLAALCLLLMESWIAASGMGGRSVPGGLGGQNEDRRETLATVA